LAGLQSDNTQLLRAGNVTRPAARLRGHATELRPRARVGDSDQTERQRAQDGGASGSKSGVVFRSRQNGHRAGYSRDGGNEKKPVLRRRFRRSLRTTAGWETPTRRGVSNPAARLARDTESFSAVRLAVWRAAGHAPRHAQEDYIRGARDGRPRDRHFPPRCARRHVGRAYPHGKRTKPTVTLKSLLRNRKQTGDKLTPSWETSTNATSDASTREARERSTERTCVSARATNATNSTIHRRLHCLAMASARSCPLARRVGSGPLGPATHVRKYARHHGEYTHALPRAETTKALRRRTSDANAFEIQRILPAAAKRKNADSHICFSALKCPTHYQGWVAFGPQIRA
jgi:hypothetical protein